MKVNGRTVYQGKGGTLNSFLDDAFASLGLTYPKFFKMDRMSKAGFLAAELLVNECSDIAGYPPEGIGVVLANAHASFDTDLKYFESMKTFASPSLFVYTLANIVTGEICIRHGFRGENAFLVSEQFLPSQLHEYVSILMSSDNNLACLAGWVDVIGDQHDVFLYLVDKRDGNHLVEHTITEIQKFYNADN
jgi:hypothetical protein